MARMGPAFDRSRFGFLVFFAGLLLTLLPTEGLMSSEDAASESLRAHTFMGYPGGNRAVHSCIRGADLQ